LKYKFLREVYEKGKQAFVSFIRAYSKHECSHIFQIKELDLVNLAKGFGLLHMPKMPEIQKDHKSIKFVQIEISTIPYKYLKIIFIITNYVLTYLYIKI
jgi:ATP-dependent RNA helicase DDX55/SPB4